MNRYETYKDSQIPWLGEVPAHWEVKRLKFLTNKIVDGAHFTPTYVNDGIPFLRVTDIQDKHIDMEKIKYIPCEEHQELIKRCNPQKGDLLLSKNGTIGVSKIIDWNWQFSIFVSLCLIKFNSLLHSNYAKYFFDSNALQEQIFGLIKKNTVINLHLDKIQNFWFAIPPILEQTAIAHYLDPKLGEIDALIGKQQTLLEKLAEQRTALITQAVTRGLNPNAPMKNSGVEWLGEMPKHWEICRLKDEVTFNDETLSDKTDLDYELLYVDISSVSLNEGITKKEAMTFENSPSRARRIVRDGDVIVSTVRTYLKAITQIHNTEGNLIVSTGFAVLRPKIGLLPRFLGYWVQSEYMIGAIVAHSVGVSYPAINATDLVRLPIVKIPLPEQTAIAAHLDKETAKIDRLCDKVNQAIERLKEYRTALITQAVTGKIKVV